MLVYDTSLYFQGQKTCEVLLHTVFPRMALGVWKWAIGWVEKRGLSTLIGIWCVTAYWGEYPSSEVVLKLQYKGQKTHSLIHPDGEQKPGDIRSGGL